MTRQQPTRCVDCNIPIERRGIGLLFCSPSPKCYHCPSCDGELCAKCSERYPLILSNTTSIDEKDDKELLNTHNLQCYCKPCFQRLSVLDFEQTYDVVEPAADKDRSMVTFVMVHGGGGSRAMFRPHAQELAKRYGHRSILMDLPGHGSLNELELTLDTCWQELNFVLSETNLSSEQKAPTTPAESAKDDDVKEKLVYVGASLGAYVGFYLLDEFKDAFDAAVLIGCGQNCGPGAPGRNFKTSLGLHLLAHLGKHCSNKKLAKMMVGVTKRSPADTWLIESAFGAGWFFDRAEDQVKVLKGVAPAHHIPELDFPILFMNGSKDHRDSERLWLDLCDSYESAPSSLKVFDGGDHFFTHDR